jgi:hypothetical protein
MKPLQRLSSECAESLTIDNGYRYHQVIVKKRCPVCGVSFEAIVPWKKYDRPYCRLKALRARRKETRNGESKARAPRR